MKHVLFLVSLLLLASPASSQQIVEIDNIARLPARGVFPQTLGRLDVNDDQSRYITFVEVNDGLVFMTIMDCESWRSRRFNVNERYGTHVVKHWLNNSDALWAFNSLGDSHNLIAIQAKYCPLRSDLPLINIGYDPKSSIESLRVQIYKDRSLVPAEYFRFCPSKDAVKFPCLDNRDAWKEQRWDPLPPDAAVNVETF